MDQPFAREITVEDRVLAELGSLRDSVVGIHGSLVATSDGLLVTHESPTWNRPGSRPSWRTLGLASQATQATGRGGFREAVARGGTGYLVVYAAGPNAVVAVLGDLSSTRDAALRDAGHDRAHRRALGRIRPVGRPEHAGALA